MTFGHTTHKELQPCLQQSNLTRNSPVFTIRHYTIIARVLKASQPPPLFNAENMQHYATCVEFVGEFTKDNPDFNKNIFLLACGVKP